MNLSNLLGSGQGAAYSRAERHLRSAQLELESFVAGADEPDVSTARQLLQEGKTSLGQRKVDDCWHFINAAKRYLAGAKGDAERSMAAHLLLIEAQKLPERRQKGIDELMVKGQAPHPAALREALWLRDDYYENRYHRIAMQGEQLRAIVLIAAVALIVILTIAGTASVPDRITQTPWDWRVLSVVLAFGVLGASFSAARGITVKDLGTLIPELALSKWITWARTLLGASLGLAGYAFLLTGILNFGALNLPTAAAVAFAGGFSEQVVLKLIGTLQAKAEK